MTAIWTVFEIAGGVYLLLCVAVCLLFVGTVAFYEGRAWLRRWRHGGDLTEALMSPVRRQT